MNSTLIKLCSVVLFLYAAFITFIYFYQGSFLYHPENKVLSPSDYQLNTTQEIFLYTDDNIKIHVWYNNENNTDKMFLFLHGNAGNISNRIHYLKSILKTKSNFTILSWRGYGKSHGKPSFEGLVNDAKTAVRFLENTGHKAENIILVGESLGTGVATKLATEKKFRGLLLISPYTSIADLAQETFFFIPVRKLLKHNFDNISHIDKIQSAVLITHGNNDTVIPHEHSKKLLNSANHPKKFILYDGKSHNDLPSEDLIREAYIFFH